MKSSETPVTSDKYGESLNYDPEFQGPVKSRSCTDIICLFLFIAFLAGWIVIGIFAYREGDPRILLYPTDSLGNICGVGKLQDKKFLFFFNLMKCANPGVLVKGCPTPQVCVETCPNETFYADPGLSNQDEMKAKLICKYDTKKKEISVKDLLEKEHCAKLYFKSTAIIGRCVPEIFFNKSGLREVVRDNSNRTVKDESGEALEVDKVKTATSSLAKFLSFTETGEKVFSDFKTSWHIMLFGLLICMGISLIWIVLMRWIAGIMIWLSIIIVLAFSVFACYYSTKMYIDLKDVPGSEEKFKLSFDFKSYLALRKTWLAFAIVSAIVFAILFVMLVFLRKRILIAIALIKEASNAVGHNMLALVFPIIPYVLMLAFFALWITMALYIASSGKASFFIADAPNNSGLENGTTCNPQNFNSTDGIKCLFHSHGVKDNLFTAQIYNMFAFFWGLFFAIGVGQVSLAGTFAAYYWTLDKKHHLPHFAICLGFYRCVRYHLGSIAFGSLLIAVVRMIRVALEYVEQKLNKYDNKFTKCLLWCLKCCFWCLEQFLKFISKNAYIMMAIYGKNFCSSARRAFMLLMRNILRVVVLDKLTDFLLFMGKLVIVAFAAAGSFYIFSSEQKLYKGMPPLNYNLLPPIFITICAYIIASAFFSVYGMAVDTLFLCFLEDCERNDGTAEKPYYMSKELMKILHKKNKFREPTPPTSPS